MSNLVKGALTPAPIVATPGPVAVDKIRNGSEHRYSTGAGSDRLKQLVDQVRDPPLPVAPRSDPRVCHRLVSVATAPVLYRHTHRNASSRQWNNATEGVS